MLLLMDILETFQKTYMQEFGLDPTHYYNTPGLAWDALLKKTGVELELLTDYDQHPFIDKGMHDSISMASKKDMRRATTCKTEGYDSSKP